MRISANFSSGQRALCLAVGRFESAVTSPVATQHGLGKTCQNPLPPSILDRSSKHPALPLTRRWHAAQIMWNCPSCSEQHEDQFDACWKCGFQLDGGRSSAGPHVEAAGHDSPSEDDFSKQPDIRLPTLTYFLIPIWIWFQIIRWLYSNPRGQPQLPTTAAGWAIEIVGLVLACFVGIPVVASMVRASYVSITRRIPGGIRMFSMFVLPQEVRARHAWFVPVYYGSIVACFVLPWAFAIWQIP